MKKEHTYKSLYTFVVLICFTSMLFLGACSTREDEPVNSEFFAMNTLMKLTVYGEKAQEASDAAIRRVSEIENLTSRYIADSDISKINASAGKAPVAVTPEVLQLIKKAVSYGSLTDGSFDITIGPLTQLWGIGTGQEKIPKERELKGALELVDYEKISIDEDTGGVMLLDEGMSIDLGGIAKGYALDEILKVLKDYNINSALINLGGSSIYALGTKPGGQDWTVAIRHPRNDAEYMCVLKLKNQALSTSGDYERSFLQNDRLYHHILDASTGYPADAGLMSVTVIVSGSVENCGILSDAMTKAAFVSGRDKGFDVINSLPGLACLAVSTDERVYLSQDWDIQLLSLSADFSLYADE